MSQTPRAKLPDLDQDYEDRILKEIPKNKVPPGRPDRIMHPEGLVAMHVIIMFYEYEERWLVPGEYHGLGQICFGDRWLWNGNLPRKFRDNKDPATKVLRDLKKDKKEDYLRVIDGLFRVMIRDDPIAKIRATSLKTFKGRFPQVNLTSVRQLSIGNVQLEDWQYCLEYGLATYGIDSENEQLTEKLIIDVLAFWYKLKLDFMKPHVLLHIRAFRTPNRPVTVRVREAVERCKEWVEYIVDKVLESYRDSPPRSEAEIAAVTQRMQDGALTATAPASDYTSLYPPLTEQGSSRSRHDRVGVSGVTQSMQAASLTTSAPSASASRAPASIQSILNPTPEGSSGSRRDRGGVSVVTQAMGGTTLTTAPPASGYQSSHPPPTKQAGKGKGVDRGPQKRSPPESREDQEKKHPRHDRREPRGGGGPGSVGRA